MILIALGANLPSIHGVPEITLHKACDALCARGVNVLAFSDVWLSAPVPISDQPWYHNAVASVDTSLDAHCLLAVLHEIEAEFGRVRIDGQRNEARVLDLDLLSYGDEIISDGLVLPHPRIHERGFVLYPLRDVAPNWVHPRYKRSVSALIDDLPADDQIERLAASVA